jgi:4-hydroxyproline epimerase
MTHRISILDTHTAGEPTRVVLDGGPDLGTGPLADRCTLFAQGFDAYRRAVVNEPRGSDVLVGALLCPPTDPACAAGVIFFNNVGTLGMCGHGTIGVGVALGHLGRIAPGRHLLETPVGVVPFDYDGRDTVSLDNVPSYRSETGVRVEVEGYGPMVGDIAWGGNWFFLVGGHGETIAPERVARLTHLSLRIKEALVREGIAGIDHIELFGPPSSPEADGKNFVLCPGNAYDRSPCGTGTSAKLACLHADGKLAPGQVWTQEGILGTRFTGSFAVQGDRIIPTITGQAYVTAEATLLLDERDPFCWGFA